MKRILTIAVAFFLASPNLIAQGDYKDGFIVTVENDTISGQLLDPLNSNSRFKSCTFKSPQISQKEYSPADLIGYGYLKGKHYSSEVVNGSFVEALVVGDLSLFRYDKKFIYKKDTLLVDVEAKQKKIETAGTLGYVTDERWRGKVAYLISDCIKDSNSSVKNLSISEGKLSKLAVDYNVCKGSRFVEIKSELSKAKITMGVIAGYNWSKVNWGDVIYNSNDPSFGIIFNLVAPRISKKSSFQLEIQFMEASFNRFSTNPPSSGAIESNEISLDFKAISIPLLFQHNLYQRGLQVQVHGGLNFDQYLDFETTRVRTLRFTSTGNMRTDTTTELFNSVSGQIGFLGGIGLVKPLNKYNVGVLFRYTYIPSLAKNAASGISHDRLSINIILTTR